MSCPFQCVGANCFLRCTLSAFRKIHYFEKGLGEDTNEGSDENGFEDFDLSRNLPCSRLWFSRSLGFSRSLVLPAWCASSDSRDGSWMHRYANARSWGHPVCVRSVS